MSVCDDPRCPNMGRKVTKQPAAASKQVEVRDRLKMKLQQQKDDVETAKSDNYGRDADVNSIESADGAESLKEKKAAKKARQKEKKEFEKRRKIEEDEAVRNAVAERIRGEILKTEQRLKSEILARDLAAKKLSKMQNRLVSDAEMLKNMRNNSDCPRNKKKQVNGTKTFLEKNIPAVDNESKTTMLEKTIPALVTIKRLTKNATPTITITFQGSTPDQNQLLETFWKDDMDNNTHITKEVQMILSVDRDGNETQQPNCNGKNKTQRKQTNKCQTKANDSTIMDISSIKLPPCISISKIPNGKLMAQAQKRLEKSDLVDEVTEKIQTLSIGDKKNKSKKKGDNDSKQEPKMITLKNPLFEKGNKPDAETQCTVNEQAKFFKSDNGQWKITRNNDADVINTDDCTKDDGHVEPINPQTYFADWPHIEITKITKDTDASARHTKKQSDIEQIDDISITNISDSNQPESTTPDTQGTSPTDDDDEDDNDEDDDQERVHDLSITNIIDLSYTSENDDPDEIEFFDKLCQRLELKKKEWDREPSLNY